MKQSDSYPINESGLSPPSATNTAPMVKPDFTSRNEEINDCCYPDLPESAAT